MNPLVRLAAMAAALAVASSAPDSYGAPPPPSATPTPSYRAPLLGGGSGLQAGIGSSYSDGGSYNIEGSIASLGSAGGAYTSAGNFGRPSGPRRRPQSAAAAGFSGTAAARPFVDPLAGQGMPYNFDWGVQEPDFGNNFDHQEESDGVVTSGQYRVNLPDGRVQVVTYSVEGDSGYQAVVTYEGEAQYPPSPPQGGNRYNNAGGLGGPSRRPAVQSDFGGQYQGAGAGSFPSTPSTSYGAGSPSTPSSSYDY